MTRDPGWKKFEFGINIPDTQHCWSVKNFKLWNMVRLFNVRLEGLGISWRSPRLFRELCSFSFTMKKNVFMFCESFCLSRLCIRIGIHGYKLFFSTWSGFRPSFMMPGNRKATGIRLEKNLKSFYQLCGSEIFIPDLRSDFLFRIPDPGLTRFRILIFSIPDPWSGSRIQGLKEHRIRIRNSGFIVSNCCIMYDIFS
jgi:hypothetical protein